MVWHSIEQAELQLRELQAKRKWWRRLARRAAVTLSLRLGPRGVEVLMIERAHREGDRWGGHMAFPGGMVDPGDRNTLAAALRETREEIGLDLQRNGRLLARLSDIATHSHRGRYRPTVVTPYVYLLEQVPPLTPNHEVAGLLWVPLATIADHAQRGSMEWRGKRRLYRQLPYYLVEDKRVWGLSLRMLDELVLQVTAHGH